VCTCFDNVYYSVSVTSWFIKQMSFCNDGPWYNAEANPLKITCCT